MLQHVLGSKIGIGDAVMRLAADATPMMGGKGGPSTIVDQERVREILAGIGVEEGGTCIELGDCCRD